MVKVDIKTGFQPASYIKKMPYQIQQGNCSIHVTATIVQTQSIAIKVFKIEEPKLKTSKKAQKESKKSFQKENRKEKNFNFSIFAIKGNITSNNIKPKSSKQKFSKITCYNYNKKNIMLRPILS